MKKIILLLFIILFISCDINFDIPPTQSVSTTVIQIESANIFAIKGALYVSVRKTLPITIYNPKQLRHHGHGRRHRLHHSSAWNTGTQGGGGNDQTG